MTAKHHDPETLAAMIDARTARLYLDALKTANENWRRTHPEKSGAQIFDEALRLVLARRRRGP